MTTDELERVIKELMAAHDRRYDQRFIDAATAVTAALDAVKEATAKAETSMEKRFEGVNEFRNTLGDQQRTLMPRAEAENRMDAAEKRLTNLELGSRGTDGQRVGSERIWAFLVAAAGVVIAIVALWRR